MAGTSPAMTSSHRPLYACSSASLDHSEKAAKGLPVLLASVLSTCTASSVVWQRCVSPDFLGRRFRVFTAQSLRLVTVGREPGAMLNRQSLGSAAWIAGSSPAMTREWGMSLWERHFLTVVPNSVTFQRISLSAGRLSRRYSGMRSECGARGREDTSRSRAARVSCLPALRPVREVLTGLGQAKAGNARKRFVACA
jgi:hypothetical protein